MHTLTPIAPVVNNATGEAGGGDLSGLAIVALVVAAAVLYRIIRTVWSLVSVFVRPLLQASAAFTLVTLMIVLIFARLVESDENGPSQPNRSKTPVHQDVTLTARGR